MFCPRNIIMISSHCERSETISATFVSGDCTDVSWDFVVKPGELIAMINGCIVVFRMLI